MKYLFVIFLTFLPCSLFADQVDSLLQIIISNNLELRALQKEHSAEVNSLIGENSLSGPTIEYSPFYTKGYHGMASSELVVSQEFDFPTLYGKRNRQIDLESKYLASQYELSLREISLQARLLCYDVICKNQLIDMLCERLEQNDRLTELLKKRMNAGDANALELNKAKLERMQVAQELVEARNEHQAAMQRLQSLNGGLPLQLSAHRFPELPEVLPTELPTQLPEVLSAESALTASRHGLSLARRNWLPSLSVGYRRNTEESMKLNGFLVGASFPLFSNAHRVQAARQRTDASELRLRQARQEAQVEQQARYEELLRIHAILDHSDTELLRETLGLLTKALQHGQITALQYYSECNDIYAKLISHINLHCDYVKLYAEIFLR